MEVALTQLVTVPGIKLDPDAIYDITVLGPQIQVSHYKIKAMLRAANLPVKKEGVHLFVRGSDLVTIFTPVSPLPVRDYKKSGRYKVS